MINYEIVMYLLHNQLFFKKKFDSLIKFRTSLMKDSNLSLFSDDINKQFKDISKKGIVDEVTSRLAVPAEEVLVVLEDMNLDEYLL